MNLDLSTLAIVLGLAYAVPQLYAFLNPEGCAEAWRRFPRSLPVGFVLMTLATLWFLYNVNRETIADFAPFKKQMLVVFAAIGVGACLVVRDYLAVRGLAVLMLLMAKLMVDTGRPHLGESALVLVNQCLAYLFVILGIWLTISPWRLRDWIQWNTAGPLRLRMGAAVRLVCGLAFAGLGGFVY